MSKTTTYQKGVLIFIVVAVGGSMVFYFGNFGAAGRGGPGDEPASQVLVRVGNQDISAGEFRQHLGQAIQERRRFGEDVMYEDLAADGTAQEILESLINSRLIETEIGRRRLSLDRETLVRQLKRDGMFLDEQGQFNAAAWNLWVQQQEGRVNWNDVYDSVEWALSQRVFGELIRASARVLESEVRDLFEEQNARIRVRYVAAAPEVEMTDEELRAYYEDHVERYQLPAERRTVFAAMPLTPPPPDVLEEILARVEAGEEFAELAREYSTLPSMEQGGDLGWVVQGAPMPEHRKTVFGLQLSEVSAPVEERGVYYLYKAVEERSAPGTGQREVRARVIGVSAELPAEEKAARMEAAVALAAEAEALGDLQAAAAERALEAYETNFFSTRSPNVLNVASADAFAFRQAFEGVEEGAIAPVIEGMENLYVGQVLEVKPAAQQDFEEVREQVATQLRSEKQRADAYQDQVRELAARIQEEAEVLQDIPRLFPELNARIQTTGEFAVHDFPVADGVFWNNQQLFAAFRGKQPGTMAGPFGDMMGGKVYFAELVERIAPGEEIWGEQWENAKDQMRQRLQEQRAQEHFMDYVANLRDQELQRTLLTINDELYLEILGLREPREAPPVAPAPEPLRPLL